MWPGHIIVEKVPFYQDLPAESKRLEELMPWSEQYRQYEESEKKKVMETQLPKSDEGHRTGHRRRKAGKAYRLLAENSLLKRPFHLGVEKTISFFDSLF